jgi:hypothetical protein
LPLGTFAGELGWEKLHNGPAKARGDPLRECRLARPGRAEEDDRARRDDTVAPGKLRFGKR